MPVKRHEAGAEEHRTTMSWLQLAAEFHSTLKASRFPVRGLCDGKCEVTEADAHR